MRRQAEAEWTRLFLPRVREKSEASQGERGIRKNLQLEVGAVLDGKVTGITNFGAFVALPGGRSGLVHISEVADAFVRDVHDYLTEQQEVRVKVLSVSPEGKISLSVKQANAQAPREAGRPRPRREAPGSIRRDGSQTVTADSGNQQFEDKLKRFMQESDGKMSGNKLFQQQRKGQRRRK